MLDYIEFGSNFFPGSLFYGLNESKMFSNITFLHLAGPNNISNIDELGEIPFSQWVSGYVSMKNFKNKTYISEGISYRNLVLVKEYIVDNSIFNFRSGSPIQLAYKVNSKLKFHSICIEDKYLDSFKFKRNCDGGECIGYNREYCLLPTSPFYHLNVSTTPQCSCHPLCGSCKGSSLSCLDCNLTIPNINATLQSTQPSCACLSHFYYNSNTTSCNQCHPLCLECTGPEKTMCVSCSNIGNSSPINVNTCSCQTHYYFDSNLSECISCHPLCSECFGPSNTQCISCSVIIGYKDKMENSTCECDEENNYIFSVNHCICKPHSYFENSNEKCIECHFLCEQCSGPNQLDCISCSTSILVYTTINSSCKCISQYFYSELNKNCTKCYSLCQECWDSLETTCARCIENDGVEQNDSQCQCKSHFYFDAIFNNCVGCHPLCFECSGETNNDCIACSSILGVSEVSHPNGFLCECNNSSNFEYSEIEKKCVCPKSYYYVSLSDICEPCHPLCLECENSSSNSSCISCHNIPNIVKVGTYTCDCQNGSFYFEKECHLCHPLCLSCYGFGNNSCAICDDGYGVKQTGNNTCDCDYHKGYNIATHKCIDCHPLCSSCFDTSLSTTCYECSYSKGAIYKQSFSCVCREHSFYNETSQQCEECFSLCTECSGSRNMDCLKSCNEEKYSLPLDLGVCECQNGYDYNAATKICEVIKCNSLCEDCLNASYCKICKSSDSIGQQNNACFCKEGYYANASTQSCEPCYFLCKSCNGPSNSNCNKCKNNLAILLDNGCQCSFQFYLDNITLTCLPCHYLCNGCNGPTNLNCTNGCRNGISIIYNDTVNCFCLLESQFIGPTQCEPCHFLCKECNGPTNNNCINGCSSNLTISSNTCICPPHTYMNNPLNQCIECHFLCKECTGNTSHDCLIGCTNNEEMKGSSCNCKAHYFINTNFNQCSECNFLCSECTGSSNTECRIGCNYNTQINGTTCLCPSHTYINNIENICSACHFLCKECTGPTNNECFEGCTNNLPMEISKCSCESHFYIDNPTKSCAKCHFLCKECFGGVNTECFDGCTDNSTLHGTVCLCQSHSFIDITTNQCSKCHFLCSECSGSTNNDCLIGCTNNETLHQGVCLCKSHSFLSIQARQCLECHFLCNECNGINNNNCLNGCSNNLTMAGTTCLCKFHFYIDVKTSQCLECDFLCNNCAGPTNNECINGCSSNLTLIGSTCYCPPYTFRDDSKKQCYECHYLCRECSGPTRNDCKEGCTNKISINGTICSCNEGEYIGLQQCINCDDKDLCLVCDATPKKCQKCRYNFTLIDDKCEVPLDYYLDDLHKKLMPCNSNCTKCNGPTQNNCTECKSNLKLSNNGKCECSSEQYFNETFKYCLKCSDLCIECYGPTNNHCTKCEEGIAINNTLCECFPHSTYSQVHAKCLCPDHKYHNPQYNDCLDCFPLCGNCLDGLNSSCDDNCRGSAIFIGPSTCDCNVSWAYNEELMVCEKCSSLCYKCKSKGICEECKDSNNMELTNGTCECKMGFYYDREESVCKLCHRACESCTGPLNSNCIDCNKEMDSIVIYKIYVSTCDVGFGYYLAYQNSAYTKVKCIKNSQAFNKINNMEYLRENNMVGCVCNMNEYLNGSVCMKCSESYMSNCYRCSMFGCLLANYFTTQSIIILGIMGGIMVILLSVVIYCHVHNRNDPRRLITLRHASNVNTVNNDQSSQDDQTQNKNNCI